MPAAHHRSHCSAVHVITRWCISSRAGFISRQSTPSTHTPLYRTLSCAASSTRPAVTLPHESRVCHYLVFGSQKKLDRETELYMEEEIFLPTVEREVFICVWELLYDWGRDLPPEQFKDMQKREGKLQMDSDAKEILSAQMLEVSFLLKNKLCMERL